mmetsp:Transcript_33931/g.89365  ORF Transcript_33931/g.89365 Transcript_33931/m.89365 type:complete len:113 (+) Transcript_33931:115-453(+)
MRTSTAASRAAREAQPSGPSGTTTSPVLHVSAKPAGIPSVFEPASIAVGSNIRGGIKLFDVSARHADQYADVITYEHTPLFAHVCFKLFGVRTSTTRRSWPAIRATHSPRWR